MSRILNVRAGRCILTRTTARKAKAAGRPFHARRRANSHAPIAKASSDKNGTCTERNGSVARTRKGILKSEDMAKSNLCILFFSRVNCLS